MVFIKLDLPSLNRIMYIGYRVLIIISKIPENIYQISYTLNKLPYNIFKMSDIYYIILHNK